VSAQHQVTHLGGRLPRVEGSSFLLPVLALLLVASSAIMDLGGRIWPCSVLTVRTGDGMAAPVLSWYQGSRPRQLCWRRRYGWKHLHPWANIQKIDPDVQVLRLQTVTCMQAHALNLKEDIASHSFGVVVKVDMATGA
jgi:hypothetical protein